MQVALCPGGAPAFHTVPRLEDVATCFEDVATVYFPKFGWFAWSLCISEVLDVTHFASPDGAALSLVEVGPPMVPSAGRLPVIPSP